MLAGKLRHDVEIQEATKTTNDMGQQTLTYATVATRRAAIEPLGMREAMYAQQANIVASHKITMRYYDGLTPEHRLVHDGRNFELVSIVNVSERKRELTIMAQEVT